MKRRGAAGNMSKKTLGKNDFKTMEIVADKLGKSFKLGVVLYDGSQTLQVLPAPRKNAAAQGFWQVPVSSLWGTNGA